MSNIQGRYSLNDNVFINLRSAQQIIETWRQVRIPEETDRHSGVKATAVPVGFRPAFRWESDRHSGAIRPIG